MQPVDTLPVHIALHDYSNAAIQLNCQHCGAYMKQKRNRTLTRTYFSSLQIDVQQKNSHLSKRSCNFDSRSAWSTGTLGPNCFTLSCQFCWYRWTLRGLYRWTSRGLYRWPPPPWPLREWSRGWYSLETEVKMDLKSILPRKQSVPTYLFILSRLHRGTPVAV